MKKSSQSFCCAVAWLSHRGYPHPDKAVHYNKRRVGHSTHAINGLRENNFTCASKADALFKT